MNLRQEEEGEVTPLRSSERRCVATGGYYGIDCERHGERIICN